MVSRRMAIWWQIHSLKLHIFSLLYRNIDIEDFILVFGADDIADLDDAIKLQFLPIQTRNITEKSLHPYETYSYPSAYKDVLLIDIVHEVDLGPQVWPACLPDAPNTNANHLVGDSVELIGYGPDTDDSTNLNVITKKIEDLVTCDDCYSIIVTGGRSRILQGEYIKTENYADSAPENPIYKKKTSNRYIFNTGSSKGWSIGKKDHLDSGRSYYSSGSNNLPYVSQNWKSSKGRVVEVKCEKNGKFIRD
jgi:hypothetical protein